MHTHLDLIAGLPGENMEDIRRSFDKLFSLHPHCLQLGFLKLLRGLKLRNSGIIFSETPPYEVLLTSTLRFEELTHIKYTERALDIAYNSGAFASTIRYLTQGKSAFDFFHSLSECIGENNVSRVNLAQLLLNGCEQTKNLLAYDLLKQFDRASLPEFLDGFIVKSESAKKTAVFEYDVIGFEKTGLMNQMRMVVIFDRLKKTIEIV